MRRSVGFCFLFPNPVPFPCVSCSLMKQNSVKAGNAATDAWPSGARSCARAALGAMAAWRDVVMSARSAQHADPFRITEHKGQRGETAWAPLLGLDGNSPSCKFRRHLLYDQETGELIHDFEEPDERSSSPKRRAARQSHFAPAPISPRSTNSAGPRERLYRLELKLLAMSSGRLPQRRQVHAHLRISPRGQDRRLPFTTLEPPWRVT